MELYDLMLLSVPVALTAAKIAILAVAVVYAAKGVFRPYGLTSALRRPTPSRVRLRSLAR